MTPTNIAPQNITPQCPHFGLCGGCQLQDIDYAAQLNNKAAQIVTSLTAANLTLSHLQLHPSPPYAYRNRIRLTLAEVEGTLRAGYLERTRPTFLPITECPIAAPLLWRAAEAFLALANEAPWLRTPQLIPDQLELFTTADESRLNLTLYLRATSRELPPKTPAAFTTLCDELRTHIPELTGAGIALLPRASAQLTRRTEIPRPGPSWGTPGLLYPVGATDYWVPRGAFFQVNRYLIPELLSLVTGAHSEAHARSGTLAWDLYAGVGLFSRALARSFTQVVAVELAEPAATALAQTKLPNLHAIKAPTLDFLRAAAIQRDRPDLIILDPPRTGAGAEVCDLLARIAAPEIVYVSCAPQALPAELVILAASGYSIAELHLVDLFPQTTHIETVVFLKR